MQVILVIKETDDFSVLKCVFKVDFAHEALD